MLLRGRDALVGGGWRECVRAHPLSVSLSLARALPPSLSEDLNMPYAVAIVRPHAGREARGSEPGVNGLGGAADDDGRAWACCS